MCNGLLTLADAVEMCAELPVDALLYHRPPYTDFRPGCFTFREKCDPAFMIVRL
jgi:hypothetical protein